MKNCEHLIIIGLERLFDYAYQLGLTVGHLSLDVIYSPIQRFSLHFSRIFLRFHCLGDLVTDGRLHVLLEVFMDVAVELAAEVVSLQRQGR